MRDIVAIDEHRIKLPDPAIAEILGLSLKEYLSLSHKPLESFRDHRGQVIQYFMHVSPLNDPQLLQKLGVSRDYRLNFSPSQIEGHFVQLNATA